MGTRFYNTFALMTSIIIADLIISNLGKLFTAILDACVIKWFDSQNKLSDAQFGFRK